jgi:hypothetical protein
MFGHSDNQSDDNQPVHDNGVTPIHDPMATPEVIMADQAGNDGTTTDKLSDIPAVPVIESNPIADSLPDPLAVLPKKDEPTQTAPPASTTPPVANDDEVDLLDLKQKALHELSPLVSHLEQTPEEKFRTTMMMIQASDDKSLLPSAYESAQAISNEKSKAQALLDVVNEINYFTQS